MVKDVSHTCIDMNHNRRENDLLQTPIRVFLHFDSVQSTFFVIVICLISYSETCRCVIPTYAYL